MTVRRSVYGDALKYAGTPAHSLGVTLEDTSATIEVMSNSGLEGSQAGTALRASFIRLAKPSAQSQKPLINWVFLYQILKVNL